MPWRSVGVNSRAWVTTERTKGTQNRRSLVPVKVPIIEDDSFQLQCNKNHRQAWSPHRAERKGAANSKCLGLPERECMVGHCSGSWAKKTILTTSKSPGAWRFPISLTWASDLRSPEQMVLLLTHYQVNSLTIHHSTGSFSSQPPTPP